MKTHTVSLKVAVKASSEDMAKSIALTALMPVCEEVEIEEDFDIMAEAKRATEPDPRQIDLEEAINAAS
jgi:hypothetical protein